MRVGQVAIIGRPNAGKSTLLNEILESELAIVSPKAQTTRERVLGIYSRKDVGQILFLDTPGIHRALEGGINEYMVKEATRALEGADVVWIIVDPHSLPKHEEVVLQHLKGKNVFVLFNKSDLKKPTHLLEAFYRAQLPEAEILQVSALKNKGLEELMQKTIALLPEGPLLFEDLDQLSDKPTRYFVAEKIRKQLYLQLGEELPYSCAIVMNKMDEKSKPIRVEATIFVERDSQKGMVIGQGAQKVKAIGQAARGEIESFLGEKVFLGLKVEVLKDWTKTHSHLKRLGYFSNQAGAI